MTDLLDASVWVPLSAPDHPHHKRARHYWTREASEELAFCRMTTLALLRHLTNPHVMAHAVMNAQGAWRALDIWLSTPRILMLEEPAGLDEILAGWSSHLNLAGGQWTDAYLAAFAVAGDHRLIAFDRDFRKFPGLDFLHLKV